MANKNEAVYVSTVDGSNKTEPDRMDGWEYKFPSIAPDATPSEALKFLEERAGDENPSEVVTAFLRDAWEDHCERSRKAHHNGKDESGKDKPQRSETLTPEQVQEFAQAITLPLPKVKPEQELAAARRAAERAEEKSNVMLETLRASLADLPKAKREERIAELAKMGIEL